MNEGVSGLGKTPLLLVVILMGVLLAVGRGAAQEPEQGTGPADGQNVEDSPPGSANEAGGDLSSEQPSPSQGPADLTADAVTAVVLKSWGRCTSNYLAWDTLNANWSDYGTTPLTIVYDNMDFCDSELTYEELVASGADVLILSDPGGAGYVYSAAEIAAIKQYAEEGHNIFGTLVILWPLGNEALAPLFGLRSDLTYLPSEKIADVPLGYQMVDDSDPLFEGLSQPYASRGFNYAQVPESDATWDSDDLNGARFMARTANNKGAITFYAGKNYQAIYISSWPEFTGFYDGTTQDLQFLYNALTFNTAYLYIPLLTSN